MSDGSSGLSWLSSNLEATAGMVTLAVTLVGFLVAWWRKRKRISYRVHLDTPIGVTPDHNNDIAVEWSYQGRDLVDPSFALVRIMNTGSREIREEDLRVPLTLEFAGRRVVDAKVIEADQILAKLLAQEDSWPPVDVTELLLPKVPLNRKHRIKVLVLLTGKPDPAIKQAVTCDGFLSGGKIVHDTTRGDGPSNRSLVLGGTALLAVGASLALLISAPWSPRTTTCAPGTIKITGSSAFDPVAKEIVQSYRDQCDEAEISVAGQGSLDGLRELDNAGRNDAESREALIAMSDGPASRNYHNLTPHPLGVVAFAVVVNKETGKHELTADQLKAIFAGEVTDWSAVGGPDLPISIVSRGAGSGTRLAFEEKVLGRSEPALSSDDCTHRNRDPNAKVTRCEHYKTSELLDQVDRLPGAIGYAEVTATTKYTNLNRIKLDNRDPDLDSVVKRGYPFWAVEYFYTYGQPQDGGLVDSMIDYTNTDAAKNILRRAGYLPCVDGPQDLMGTLCR
ncbi:Phosphate ABC transporter, periplasmic phosphate-binding protein PstS (TC 3.A.1.7.1) [Alloactinosynnema sp. L-07]|uniref:PstS family phosphate ABC transporter substrate-binding protein n=1 Tax=Alloactinosynnema sp. L-07 TaxID=1653480 RepID=UPI00065F0B09|nr:substrate-binding domain-containing protein [Alloactinosynnema sp. L-07]CRK58792.1 Phosphate ABC transporter, periplasmic phosphate-binding protein PstS (TC 3.A.1.7.1) [Alloactinosynnema sp. L-07]